MLGIDLRDCRSQSGLSKCQAVDGGLQEREGVALPCQLRASSQPARATFVVRLPFGR